MDANGLIVYKEASKKRPTPVIEKVNQGHPALRDWEVTIQRPVKKVEPGSDQKTAKFNSAYFITNLYKPDAVACSYLAGPIQKEYFSRVELIESLRQKLEENKLLFKDKVAVTEEMRADLNLAKILPAKRKEKPSQAPKADLFPALGETNGLPEIDDRPQPAQPPRAFKPEDPKAQKVSLNTVEEALLLRCSPGHLVTDLRTGKQSTKKGSHFRLSLTVERNMNKFLTKISGLDTFGFSIKEVLGDLQVRFATSGSIHESVLHKHPIEEIWLQGAFGEELKIHLSDILGVDQDIIHIVDKAKVLKKK
jgi:translation initiation factor 1 (eIF-1/SUI1)